MGIPLNLLVDFEKNVYEMTSAAVKRAAQLTVTGDEDVYKKHSGKIVSTAIDQVLDDKVKYQRVDD